MEHATQRKINYTSMGNTIITPTGKVFNPLNMTTDDVDPRDICHGLSRNCLFGGMTRTPYTLAEFAVNLHEYILSDFRGIMLLAEKKNKTTASGASSLSLRTMRWLALMYYAPSVYLLAIQGRGYNIDVQYGRIMACILKYFGAYDKRIKCGMFVLDTAADVVKNEYINTSYHRRVEHLGRDMAEREWGSLYRRLSGDVALFKSDGAIAYR